MQLTVVDAHGKTTQVEDAGTVRAVMRELAAFFPQLRVQ
jgi:hypothetical protein